MFVRRALPLLLGGLAICVGAACETTNPPINPTFPTGVTIESFSGSLPLLGFKFYSFTAPRAGSIAVTLLSLREGTQTSSATIGIGLGVPRGTDCIMSSTVSTGPGAAPQLTVEIEGSGVLCVRVFDTGTLTVPVDFSLNVNRPS
jgi:hypothetical protein